MADRRSAGRRRAPERARAPRAGAGRRLLSRARPAPCRAPVRLRRPKETASAGFYVALGDAARSRRADDVETRVYFNVTPAGAPALVSVCTRLLNGAAIPFELKVADHPAGYDRCDPAVLYLDEGGVERLAGLMPAIFSACHSHLRPRAPAFTRPLVPGIAVGEHRPALGGSFGSFRCRLVAEGVVAAQRRGTTALPERLDAVAARFADHGLDLDLPYLAPRSTARHAS